MNTRTAVITALSVTALGALYIFNSPSASSALTMADSNSGSKSVPGLEFSLSQISRNPPSLLVTLKNNNPTSSFTVLKWGTPLDPAALNMGVFKVVDSESGEEVPSAVIKVSRMMPPSQEDLVTVAPGTEEAVELVFDKPWMPKKTGVKYRVKAEGEFGGVWDKNGGELKEDDLMAYNDSPFNGRSFETNEVGMLVE